MSGAGIKKILFLSVILSGLLAGCSQKEMPRPTPEEGKYLIYYLNTATTKLVPREYEAEATDKEALVDELMEQFHLEENRRIATFSKGMKKQVLVIIGVCAATKYLFCDETFDGLDPVMRQAVKSLFAAEIMNREFTPVIASHNLRELEDICDHVGLLHRGGILFSRDLDEMKLGMFKLQCIFTGTLPENAWQEFDLLRLEQRGSLYTLTARGSREELLARINAMNPSFCEMLPLTLEEIFINETEVAGYDVKKLLF